MKPSKLLAMLALAGMCGVSETEARPNKNEIRHLEKRRAEYEEACKESKDRMREMAGRHRELVRARETEAARMREAARELARVDKAIKKARV